MILRSRAQTEVACYGSYSAMHATYSSPRDLPPPPRRIAASIAPVASLPSSGVQLGHYRLYSDHSRLSGQSESSLSESIWSESDVSSQSSAGDADSDASDDDSDGTESDSDSGASADSSFSDPDASDDDIAILSSEKHHRMSRSTSSTRPFWQTDNLGVLALMVPISGLTTMLLTEMLACVNQFDCSTHYPTLSYAAVFKPAGHAFTLGMCLTALFILVTVALFHWFLRLRLLHPGIDQYTRVMSHVMMSAGVVTSISLSGLAIFDMGAYHDTHLVCTVVFFIVAWVLITSIQAMRRRMLQEDEDSKYRKPLSLSTCAQIGSVSGLCAALWQCRPNTIVKAHQIGKILIIAGLTATASFGLFFLMVNGMWPNPLGFTAVQEALLEAFAIVCQLLFMGTLSCELAMLTRVVEQHDYQELERAE